jgi:uncharacterized protein (TIGR01319 family)
MKIDLLVCEIGSTTTVVNAFMGIGTTNPEYIGQGYAPTSVLEGDVSIGVNQAINHLATNLNVDTIEYKEMFATSSAAGGLKMTVHGLVYEMTANAAFEAALGAGANIHLVTAGKMRRTDLKKIKELNPNIILVAGGVDYGERDTALDNIEKLMSLDLDVPIIYAGNIENHEEVEMIFDDYKKKQYLKIVDNVYPRIDELNVEPTREVIHDTFEEHIIHASGMEKIKELVTGAIIPTPGAVMEASKMLYEEIGDLVCVDVGGATTDIHSVTEGSEEFNKVLISVQPKAKRTVEGDLGCFVSVNNVIDFITKEKLAKNLSITESEVEQRIDEVIAIPESDSQIEFITEIARECVYRAMDRHAGSFRDLFTTSGRKKMAEGKDLTEVKYIIGTGGAMSRLPAREEILANIHAQNRGDKMYPTDNAKVLIDHDYIMASLGVMSKKYKEDALILMKKSLGIN